jgi:hypothetical protein
MRLTTLTTEFTFARVMVNLCQKTSPSMQAAIAVGRGCSFGGVEWFSIEAKGLLHEGFLPITRRRT